jgi:hypothetical protein
MTVTFTEIDRSLASQLLAFVNARNEGKSIEIDGESYLLEYISHNKNAFFRSRGLSVYFRVGDDVIRISDHWAASNHHDRSRKLNCGRIDEHVWEIDNATADTLSCSWRAGRFAWVMLAGRASIAELTAAGCDHWSDETELAA